MKWTGLTWPEQVDPVHDASRSSSSSSSLFYLPNNTTVWTSTSIQFRRAGQQGQTRTLTAALKRLIKQLLGTYFTTRAKHYKQTRKLEKSIFSMLFLKTFKDVKFTVYGGAFQTFINYYSVNERNFCLVKLTDCNPQFTNWSSVQCSSFAVNMPLCYLLGCKVWEAERQLSLSPDRSNTRATFADSRVSRKSLCIFKPVRRVC